MDSQGGVSTTWFRLLSEPTSAGAFAFVAGRYDPRQAKPGDIVDAAPRGVPNDFAVDSSRF
jgi:hypothetical protein